MRRKSTSKNGIGHTCERRASKRLLCADLVQVAWTGPDGKRNREIVILENLSLAGVGLFMGVPIPEGTEVHLVTNDVPLTAYVRQCNFRENGYVVGLELHSDSKWAQEPGRDFVPEHLLDVSLLDLE